MTTNRKIKTDQNLEIEANQVDINCNIDISGDVGSTTATITSNATVGGDIDVTGDVGGATATITGNATVGGDVDVTGDVGGATATITGNASVGGNASVTGNVSCVDIDATGDLGGATLTTTSNASVGGNVACVDVDATGDVGSATVTTTGNATIGGNASVTGNVSCVDVDATGDIGGATATITGNSTIGGTLGVTGQATLSGLTYPTSDGSSGQAITTNGSGVLTFSTISGGGGGSADVDTIASASDATNYTGTARFINITSTAAVTFTNATIENRIIYNTGGQNVTFEVDNFKNNIYRSSGSGYLYIRSKGDGTDSGVSYNNMIISNCDILNGNWVVILAGAHNPSGTGQTDLFAFMSSCRINASTLFHYTSAGYGKHYIGYSNITGWNIYNNETRDDSLNLRYGTRIEAGNFYGYANILTDATINAGGSNGNTVKIENGTDTFVNGIYNHPFTANMDNFRTNVITLAKRSSNQSITSSATNVQVVFNSEQSDDTGSYNNSTGVFTAKVKGNYMVTCSIEAGNLNSNEGVNFKVFKGSATYIKKALFYWQNNYGHTTIAHTIPLDIGDTISFYIESAGDDDFYVDTNSSISISKIN